MAVEGSRCEVSVPLCASRWRGGGDGADLEVAEVHSGDEDVEQRLQSCPDLGYRWPLVVAGQMLGGRLDHAT